MKQAKHLNGITNFPSHLMKSEPSSSSVVAFKLPSPLPLRRLERMEKQTDAAVVTMLFSCSIVAFSKDDVPTSSSSKNTLCFHSLVQHWFTVTRSSISPATWHLTTAAVDRDDLPNSSRAPSLQCCRCNGVVLITILVSSHHVTADELKIRFRPAFDRWCEPWSFYKTTCIHVIVLLCFWCFICPLGGGDYLFPGSCCAADHHDWEPF